jgi:hypothetical protein
MGHVSQTARFGLGVYGFEALLLTNRNLNVQTVPFFDGSFPYGSRELRQSDHETNLHGLASIDAPVGQIDQNNGGGLRIVWTCLAVIVGAAVLIGGGIALFLIHRRHLSEATMSDETEAGDIQLPGDSEASLAGIGNYTSGDNALSHDHSLWVPKGDESSLALPGLSE